MLKNVYLPYYCVVVVLVDVLVLVDELVDVDVVLVLVLVLVDVVVDVLVLLKNPHNHVLPEYLQSAFTPVS